MFTHHSEWIPYDNIYTRPLATVGYSILPKKDDEGIPYVRADTVDFRRSTGVSYTCPNIYHICDRGEPDHSHVHNPQQVDMTKFIPGPSILPDKG